MTDETRSEFGEVEEVPAPDSISDNVSDETEIEEITAEDPANEPEEEHQEEKPIYAFKWDYTEQYVHDNSEEKKREVKRNTKGARGYVGIMIAIFALAFAILIASLVLDDIGGAFKEAPDTEYSISRIVEIGMPSTVAIFTDKGDGTGGAGSGFVLNDMGYIITNYHVVDNSVNIAVVDTEQRSYSASLVGYDEEMDVALIYAENCKLEPVTIGDSSGVKLGGTVVAIGSPNGENFMFSVSDGIISGVDRNVGSKVGMLQTNAPLNPGNSGGPLFDGQGRVIGIVTSKLIKTEDANGEEIVLEGMAFAIPINSAVALTEKWIEDDLKTPMLGVTAVGVEKNESYFFDNEDGVRYLYSESDGKKYMSDGYNKVQIPSEKLNDPDNFIVKANATGVLITSVTRGLGADGVLKKKDIVTQINGVPVTTVQEVKAVFVALKPGDKIKVKFYRDGELKEATMTLKTKGDMLNAEK